MRLDLRSGHDLPGDLLEELNRLSEELRPEYYSLIDRCTRAFERPHTWLLSCPATRNPLAGNLLKHLVIIYLLEKMAEKGTLPSEILVDSAPLAEVLRSKLSSLDVDIPIHNLSRKSLFRIIKTFFKRVVSPLLWHLRLHYHFYRTRPASRKPKNNDIILVHTFVSPNTIDLHNTFGQAIAWLSKADQKRIWRVPSFFGLPRNQLSRFCEQLRAAPGNWMIKEDYLRLSDFFMAWTALLRSQRLDVPTVVYKDTDVSSLIREELAAPGPARPGLEAFLNVRLAKRFKEADVHPHAAVNWYENQQIDRGWNLGLQTYLPKVPRIGYAGYPVYANYLPPYPSSEELRNRVLPNEVGVIGDDSVVRMREFCPEIPLFLAPAFRYAHLFNTFTKHSQKYQTVLVALPQSLGMSRTLLKHTRKLAYRLNGRARIIVRPHPTADDSRIQYILNPDGIHPFVLNRGPLEDILEKTDLMISHQTSTAMEAMVRGILVIEIQATQGLMVSGIANGTPPLLFRKCYHYNQLESMAMECLEIGRAQHEEAARKGLQLRLHHFHSPDSAGARRLFRIEATNAPPPQG